MLVPLGDTEKVFLLTERKQKRDMGKSWFKLPEKQEDKQKSSKQFFYFDTNVSILEAMSDTCFAYEWGHKLLTSAFHGAEKNGEHQGPSKQDSENLSLGIASRPILRKFLISALLTMFNICFQEQTEWWGTRKRKMLVNVSDAGLANPNPNLIETDRTNPKHKDTKI